MNWSNPSLGCDFGKLNVWFHYSQPNTFLRIAFAEYYGESTAILCEREMVENGMWDGAL